MDKDAKRLEARVRRLERSNGLLLLALVCVAGLPVLVGATRSQEAREIEATRIRLVDAEGRVRIDLRHDDSETGMFILDDDGDTRLGAAQFSHGGGGYALHGPGGRGAAVLYLRGDGSLTFYDDKGGVTARVPGGRP